MMDCEPEIRKYILERFFFGEAQDLDGNASLVDAGIVNSTGILELIAHIEATYGITIDDSELVPENFDTISGIRAFLGRKLSKAAGRNE